MKYCKERDTLHLNQNMKKMKRIYLQIIWSQSNNLIQHMIPSVPFILKERVRNPEWLVTCHVNKVKVTEITMICVSKSFIKPFLFKTNSCQIKMYFVDVYSFELGKRNLHRLRVDSSLENIIRRLSL